MSEEGDDLLNHIRGFVRGRVHPNQEQLVTELVGRTVVLIMTTPSFFNHLRVIQDLQRENWQLRQALIAYQHDAQARAQRARARKASAAKKAAPRKAAPRKAAPSNVRPFKRGSSSR